MVEYNGYNYANYVRESNNSMSEIDREHHLSEKHHMKILWEEFFKSDNNTMAQDATLVEKTSIVGRVGIMLLSCGTGAWRVRDSMDTVARTLGITCSTDIGLVSIEYTCFDVDNESYSQTLSLVRWFQTAKPRHALIVFVGILALLGGGGAYSVYANRVETITIAGKLGSEPDILINMYKQLIEAEDDHIHVTLKPNFGKTTFLFSALKNNQIDIYPEFTGSVLETLVKGNNPASQTANQTYQLAKKRLAKQEQMTYLKPMQYNNTYALAVTKKFQQEYHLKTISDLTQVESILKPGMTLEFIDRDDGLKGIKKTYGLDVTAKSMEPALRYEAISKGKINLVDAYATDSELRQYNLALLKDDKHFFPTYQGAPLMKTSFANKHPKVVQALNKLAGKISETDMQEMNYEVNVKKKSASTVAHNYLVKHGLLKEGR